MRFSITWPRTSGMVAARESVLEIRRTEMHKGQAVRCPKTPQHSWR